METREELTKKTIQEALIDSIHIWEQKATVNTPQEISGFDFGMYGCPLCALFLIPNHRCDGCPVYERAGNSFCNDTPYMDVTQYLQDGFLSNERNFDNYKEAARREVEFLKACLT